MDVRHLPGATRPLGGAGGGKHRPGAEEGARPGDAQTGNLARVGLPGADGRSLRSAPPGPVGPGGPRGRSPQPQDPQARKPSRGLRRSVLGPGLPGPEAARAKRAGRPYRSRGRLGHGPALSRPARRKSTPRRAAPRRPGRRVLSAGSAARACRYLPRRAPRRPACCRSTRSRTAAVSARPLHTASWEPVRRPGRRRPVRLPGGSAAAQLHLQLERRTAAPAPACRRAWPRPLARPRLGPTSDHAPIVATPPAAPVPTRSVHAVVTAWFGGVKLRGTASAGSAHPVQVTSAAGQL